MSTPCHIAGGSNFGDISSGVSGSSFSASWEPGFACEFEYKVVEAAAEFFAASGHREFADHLLAAAKAAGQGKEKSRRTAQRREMENKRQLRKDLME
jgi:hypothetical protein